VISWAVKFFWLVFVFWSPSIGSTQRILWCNTLQECLDAVLLYRSSVSSSFLLCFFQVFEIDASLYRVFFPFSFLLNLGQLYALIVYFGIAFQPKHSIFCWITWLKFHFLLWFWGIWNHPNLYVYYLSFFISLFSSHLLLMWSRPRNMILLQRSLVTEMH
jgi:hypothetical protein